MPAAATVAPNTWTLLRQVKPRSSEEVHLFAKQHKIAPGVLVGRMQREKTIPGSHLNALKTRLKSRRRKAGHAIDTCGKVFGSSISGFLASVEHVRHSRGPQGSL